MATSLSDQERDQVNDIYRVLVGIRRSIDISFPRFVNTEDFKDQRNLMNDIEALRFTLGALRRPSRYETNSEPFILVEAQDLIESIRSNPSIRRFFDRRYRPLPLRQAKANNQMSFELEEEDLTVSEALEYCYNALSRLATDHQETSGFNPARFKEIIPQQKVAPTQFYVENDRIHIASDTTKALEGSEAVAEIAREEVIGQNAEIIQELSNSNCHPRIRGAFEDLGAKLREDANAIRIGLDAIKCQSLMSQFSGEIPDATIGLMLGHLKSVQMIIGQYEEWRKFCENALETDLDEEAQAVLENASGELAHLLSEHPSLADPEVPKTLLFIRECISNPKMAVARTGYAALSTIENLISAVFNYSKELIDESFRRSIKVASVAMGGTLGLAAVGFVGAELIAPVAGAAPNGQWVLELLKLLKAP